MGRFQFIWEYLGGCIGGQLSSAECAPLWQFGIIILLLVFAVAALIVIRLITTDDPERVPVRTPRPGTRKKSRNP